MDLRASQDPHNRVGNAVAGELSNIFATDVTVAEGRCAHFGAMKCFAEAHLYMQSPSLVARCAECQHVLLRLAHARHRVFLDVRGMTCLILNTSQLQESSQRMAAGAEAPNQYGERKNQRLDVRGPA